MNARHPILLLLLLAALAPAVERTVGPLLCPMGREYWLGFPHGYDPARTYWLVVVGHGAKGNGGRVKDFALSGPRTDYIVLAPSFPNTPEQGFFQILGGAADQQVIGLHKKLRETYNLHPQLFVHGFSAGGQFAHRFAMTHPAVVAGCSAHGSGTWGPELSKKALGLPFAVSCGLEDIERSTPDDLPRIEEAEQYFADLLKAGHLVKMRYWAGVGHHAPAEVSDLAAECFELATTGLFPVQRAAIDAELSRIDQLIDGGTLDEAKKALTALPKLKLPHPAAKSAARSLLPADQQAAQREAFTAAGLGGRNGLNRDFWIDDRGENEYGWNEPPAARTGRGVRAKIWLAEQTALRTRRIAELRKANRGGGER